MNPRILFVVKRFGTASEVWLYRQACGLQSVDVRVICNIRENHATFPYDESRIEELLVEVGSSNRKNGPVRKIKQVVRALASRFVGQNARTLILNRRLNAKIQTHKPKAILYQGGTTAARYLNTIRKSKIPFAVHFNGCDLSAELNRPDYVEALREISKQADAIIVVAEYMRANLLKLGVNPERIHTVPYGIPTEVLQPSTHVGDTPCQFLSIGRLTEKKAPKLAIKAFASCYKQYPECRFTIIGDGPLKLECQNLVAGLGIENVVEFLGAQPPEVVQQHLRQASVFVQHSVTSSTGDSEGWPVAVAEAAASGLPIVSTRHASIPEQVVHNKTGFLVDEFDWEEMSSRMLSLANSPDTRIEFGRQARLHIAQWDVAKQVDKLDRILLNLTKQT